MLERAVVRPRRIVVALLAAVLAGSTMGAVPAGSPTAATAVPAGSARLDITDVSATVAADRPVIVSGTVTNTSAVPLAEVQVYLRASSTPVTTRAALGDALDNDGPVAGTRRLSATYAEVGDPLPPGVRRPFILIVPAAELNLDETGVSIVDVEVRADGRNARVVVATQRLGLPSVPAGRTLPVTVLVPVTDRPHRLSTSIFLDDDLAASLAPTGRLGRIVAAAGATGVPVRRQLVIDPALLEDVITMASGYQVLDRTGKARVGASRAASPTPLPASSEAIPTAGGTTPTAGLVPAVTPTANSASDGGPLVPSGSMAPRVLDGDLPAVRVRAGGGRDVAARWLVRLHTAVAGVPVLLLPWGDPDPGATPLAVLRAAVARGEAIARAAGLPARTLIWPATLDGVLDQRGLVSTAATGSHLALVSSAATAIKDGRTTPLHPLPLGVGTVVAVRTDNRLDRLAVGLTAAGPAAGPPTTSSRLQRRGRLLSETAVLAVAAIAPDSVAFILPRDWDPAITPMPLLAKPPADIRWLVAGPDLSTSPAADAEPVVADTIPGSDPIAAPPAVPRQQVNQADRLARRVTTFTSVLPDPGAVRDGFANANLALISRSWSAAHPPDAYRRAISDIIDGLEAGVKVLGPRRVTLSSDQGRFPVTIINRLGQPVRVRLKLSTANRLRLDIASPMNVITVPAGDSVTVTLRAVARVRGDTPVTATLLTPAGARLGEQTSFVVNAQHYDAVGWVIIGGALVVLFGATGVRVFRRVRAARRRGVEPRT